VLSIADQYNITHSKNQEWLAAGKVELRGGNGSAFTDWWDNGGGAAVVFAGRQLGDWEQWADQHRALRAQVCGSTISGPALRHLYTLVYADWPAYLRPDPW
jgi:hypothetical protein